MVNDEVTRWFNKNRKKEGFSWERIRLAYKDSEESLKEFLRQQEENNDWPALTVDEWYQFIDEQHRTAQEVAQKDGAAVIHAVNELNELKVPEDEDSAWQTYRDTLKDKGFPEGSIDVIEKATIEILHNLSRNTHATGAIKGLVVGNVQSGKTANMTALMAMAADHGWNMFVILSGMMNNLKVQTSRRITSDLNYGRNLEWQPINDPSARSPYGEKLRDLHLTDSRNRYFTVCIKNAERLRQLLDWLNYGDGAAKKNLRMLIIDDESDQASINVADQEERERTVINKLILDLVNDRTRRHEPAKSQCEAINYIGYTATPYANVLNEGPDTDSLYPKDFIATLDVSDEYFGPQQIFGLEAEDTDDSAPYSGMNIINTISDSEKDEIKDIHEGASIVLPSSLKRSICWFLDGVAYMRLAQYKKPVSMLIHTSRERRHHDGMRNAITQWYISTPIDKKIELCREVWEEEKAKFKKEDFAAACPDYGKMRGAASIESLPAFDKIKPYLIELLNVGLTTILLEDNGDLGFTQGVHLCVDNSNKNNDATRLFYPEEEMSWGAPAFLVIGGNTLSRGLTIEGLISTYFLRPAKCADTLMQMGRWFGYRRGYELLPRIWMTQKIKGQFEFMSMMDQRLRDEIRLMVKTGVSPTDYGPKIMASPSAKWLQIVARNRQQNAKAADYDFTGHTKETDVFENNAEKLEWNMAQTRSFLLSLGTPTPIPNNPYSKRNIVWKDVDWQKVRSYLTEYKHSARQRGFNDIEALTKWMDQITDEGILGKWNVILAGVNDDTDRKEWALSDDLRINMVERTQKTPDRTDGLLNIGTIRSFSDFLSDIEIPDNDLQLRKRITGLKHTQQVLNEFRRDMGLEQTPQIVVYIINKDSKPDKQNKQNKQNATTRFPLEAVRDIAGFSINIPGQKNSRQTVKTIQINIPEVDGEFAD
ncbi:MAG: Z1 domain-containing protein [Muribaculaceae bacterium]|nr:Z1 domain-containing protein [Muribaculaceae bacterium]